ncbi:MAG: DUF4080 domain-containing protein [Lentisphaerae bacterium]|nr:DUF4080 domain-containing protein [Lentisphaerota bacterium]
MDRVVQQWKRHVEKGAAHQPGRWSKIPGLCGRLGRRVFDNGLAPTVQDLDDIPSPYARHLEGFDKPFILLETARGCSNRCSFCTSADSGPIRVFSTDRLRRELTLIQSHGIPEVRITDRTFNGKPSRCLELLRLFRDEFPGLRFHLEFDPARLTPSILGELAKTPAGQFHIEAGIQSLLPRAFRLIGRQATLRRTLAGVKALVQCVPLRIHTDLIAGLPGTTLKSLLADVRRLAAIGPGEIQVELLKLLPGTRLAAERDRLGLVAAPEPPYEILRGPAFPLEDANSARQLAFLTDWYYNAVPLQAVIRVASESLPSFWKKWLAFHRTKHRAFACPSLERRFALLFEFVSKRESAHSARLKQRIQYAWMKYGFSAQHGLCAAQPWTDPIPADAVLVEGDRQATASRVYRVSLDRDYLFVYGRKHEHQRAVAVYVLK